MNNLKKELDNTGGWATALQGFGAGVAGRGAEFLQGLDDARSNALVKDAYTTQQHLLNGNVPDALALLNNRVELLGDRDNKDTQGIIDLIGSGNIQGAIGQLQIPIDYAIGLGKFKPPQMNTPEATAEQRNFEALAKGLSEEEKARARLIALGLAPRAGSSMAERIALDEDLTDAVAKSQQAINQRKKFGEMTGASRAKAIDSGFDKIKIIDKAVSNIDRAISVLDRGAGVGAVEKLLPSFKAASVELDNIQGSMALDVVGATTFGALSAGELQLAKEVALPTGLNTNELKGHLERRKAAQNKLRDYFNEQIQFLDQGGTVAGFLRQKEREALAGGGQNPAATQDLKSLSDEDIDRMLRQAQ